MWWHPLNCHHMPSHVDTQIGFRRIPGEETGFKCVKVNYVEHRESLSNRRNKALSYFSSSQSSSCDRAQETFWTRKWHHFSILRNIYSYYNLHERESGWKQLQTSDTCPGFGFSTLEMKENIRTNVLIDGPKPQLTDQRLCSLIHHSPCRRFQAHSNDKCGIKKAKYKECRIIVQQNIFEKMNEFIRVRLFNVHPK